MKKGTTILKSKEVKKLEKMVGDLLVYADHLNWCDTKQGFAGCDCGYSKLIDK